MLFKIPLAREAKFALRLHATQSPPLSGEAKATFNSLIFSAKSIHIEDVDTNVGYVCDPIVSQSADGDNIAPGWQARWRPRHAFRFPPRDSKRVGKFAAYAGARREALDMYPRERRKPTDAAKSPARFERNAWRICAANSTLPSYHQQICLTPGQKSRAKQGCN